MEKKKENKPVAVSTNRPTISCLGLRRPFSTKSQHFYVIMQLIDRTITCMWMQPTAPPVHFDEPEVSLKALADCSCILVSLARIDVVV